MKYESALDPASKIVALCKGPTLRTNQPKASFYNVFSIEMLQIFIKLDKKITHHSMHV